ncbi:MAG: hypothetical protein ACYC4Q_09080 [Victivallaceae bacterium]
MKKCTHKAIISILSGVIFALAAISSCHAEVNSKSITELPMDDIRTYLKETGQKGFSFDNDIKVPTVPEFLYWRSWEDLYGKGGVDVQFQGRKLKVKLGFIRGGFDLYTQTYKAEPVISLVVNESQLVMLPYLRSGQSARYVWTNTVGTLNVAIEFLGQTVKISNNANTSEQVTVSYSDLLAAWVDFASSYCSAHLAKKYCIVPQRLWNGSIYKLGWVVTENTPLYYTTAMPQDYVELFLQESTAPDFKKSYKPISYSLPLRLTFVLSPSQTDVWEIRQMTAEEAGNEMVAEYKNHKHLSMFSSLSVPGMEVAK